MAPQETLPIGSLSKKAQDKIQQPQVPSVTERATSLGLVFFSKYAMLDPSFKEKNTTSHSQPHPPQLPFANIVFKDIYFVASCTTDKGTFLRQTKLAYSTYLLFLMLSTDTKYLKHQRYNYAQYKTFYLEQNSPDHS